MSEGEVLTRGYQQQTALAQLSQRALAQTPLETLMNEATTLVAGILDVEYAEVLERLPDGDTLLLTAGVGWKGGAVGGTKVSSGADSHAGYALNSGEPAIVEDLRKDTRFPRSSLLREHGIVSGVTVVIKGREHSYGVLGAHGTKRRVFTGDDIGFLRAVADVLGAATERKRTEDALKESAERFRATFERAAVGIAHVAPDGSWLRVNDRLCEIVGYARAELFEKTSHDVTHYRDRRKDLEQARRLLSGEIETYSMEKRYLRKDGSVVWVNLTNSLVRAPSGEPAYFIVVIEDIHERKRAQEELRLRERAVTASTNSIVITDPGRADNPIIYVNPAFEKTTGYAAEEVIGRNCRFLQGADRDQPALREVRSAIREGRQCTVVLRNYRKDGALFWNELNIYPVRDESGRVTSFVGVQNDITERLQAEKALSEIRRAERRRIARDLHDMVLQDLSGALQSLRLTHLRSKSSGLDLDLEEELEALRRTALGLRSAIYDLRHEKEQPFVKAVGSLVELNRQAAPEREIELIVEEGFPEELPKEVGVELLRILQEALTNVRRHSRARHVEVKLRTADGEVLAEVSDDGRGFDPASAQGGVGLSVMHERVEALGGEIEVMSRTGEGTRVMVKVPLRDDTQAPRRQ